MKAALLLLCCTIASAQDGGAMPILPEQRAAIVEKLRDAGERIEALEREVSRLKSKLGCA